MRPDHIKLEDGWKQQLGDEFQKQYMQELRAFLVSELKQKKIIYPKGSEIFSAFNYTTFDKVKVVIVGQDPYHGPGQAHGICFSVRPEVPPPPSLKNIFKELQDDLAIPIPEHGCLLYWAQQGVLLLNAVLTVEKSLAASHSGRGWELFTDRVIEVLNEHKHSLVFLLWGGPAQKKCSKVNGKKHLILRAPHPSPLSAARGFLGCRHFSLTNKFLAEHAEATIDWRIPPLTDQQKKLLQ